MILNGAENIMIGNTEVLKVYAGDNEVWTRSGFRELRGVPPLSFRGNGTILLDWTITGAAGGVGKVGTNFLNLREIADGELGNGQGGSITAKYINAARIPGGAGKTDVAYNQFMWVYPDYTSNDLAKDARTASYATAQWFAHLPAGDYKLIMEGVNGPGDAWLPCRRTVNNEAPFLKLFTENGTEIISDTDPFDGLQGRERWVQNIYEFTVAQDQNVGLFTKIYPRYGNMYFRYMIVPADTPMQQFTNTEFYTGPITGETCWEPYRFIIPIIVSSGDQITTIDIYIDEALTENDTLTMAAAGVTIPTYNGTTTIDVGTDITPSEMYIKYSI